MRAFKLCLFFLAGLLLGGFSVLAFAESIPATSSSTPALNWYYLNSGGFWWGPTALAACQAQPGNTAVSSSSLTCLDSQGAIVGQTTGPTYYCPSGVRSGSVCNNALSCPAGGNWTLSDATCSRPDCVAPQVRNQSDGTCSAPACTVPNNENLGTFSIPKGTIAAGGYCINGCRAYGPHGTILKTDTKVIGTFSSYGEACPDGTPSASLPTTSDSSCASRGMCSASLNGNNACAPCVETTTQQTTTGPAGTSTTITSCNAAGACSTTTTNGGNTTTINSSSNSNGRGTMVSDGQGNYKLDLPTDYQRDATGQSAADTLKEINDKLKIDSSDDSAITTASHSPESQTALDGENKKFTDAATGVTDATSGTRGAWSAAMESGWWSPVTLVGCQPFVMTFGGKTVTIDHCPTAAKISEIGAYCLWFSLVIGVFVMLTGGKVQAA